MDGTQNHGDGLIDAPGDDGLKGSASTARHFGMPPLLIGMVIVGFGTSGLLPVL